MPSFLVSNMYRLAYTFFPPEDRSDEDRAAIDLISKLLMPTAGGRKGERSLLLVVNHTYVVIIPLR